MLKINKIKNIISFTIEIAIILLMVIFTFLQCKDFIQSHIIKHEIITKIEKNTMPKVLTETEMCEKLLLNNDNTISFYAKTFQISKEALIDNLTVDYASWKDKNDNFDLFLINYLFNLENSNKKLFNNKRIPCIDTKEYMVSLIKYYTNIYPKVDFSIAAAIAEVESNYTANGMLKSNNIFGGLSNGKLIKYKNIEYGILRYIKLLNDNYFSKDLTTIEKIGKVYNPTFNENGEKIAKPSWVINVTKASNKYINYQNVDIDLLNSLKKSS